MYTEKLHHTLQRSERIAGTTLSALSLSYGLWIEKTASPPSMIYMRCNKVGVERQFKLSKFLFYRGKSNSRATFNSAARHLPCLHKLVKTFSRQFFIVGFPISVNSCPSTSFFFFLVNLMSFATSLCHSLSISVICADAKWQQTFRFVIDACRSFSRDIQLLRNLLLLFHYFSSLFFFRQRNWNWFSLCPRYTFFPWKRKSCWCLLLLRSWRRNENCAAPISPTITTYYRQLNLSFHACHSRFSF